MATEVRTFDLYNTTNIWLGYSIDGYETEQLVTVAYYNSQFSSNPIGSQVDFFIDIPSVDLPYFWKKYWWDQAVYYSNPLVLSAIQIINTNYYKSFSESIGTLYYLSRVNNLKNAETKVYSPIIAPLIRIDISEEIDAFYAAANALFVYNIGAIGPGIGTDTIPASSNLIMADTDLTRRITSNLALTAAVNELYPDLYTFLPYNTQLIGNLFTPYYWKYLTNGEGQYVYVDFSNNNIETIKQLTTDNLIAK